MNPKDVNLNIAVSLENLDVMIEGLGMLPASRSGMLYASLVQGRQQNLDQKAAEDAAARIAAQAPVQAPPQVPPMPTPADASPTQYTPTMAPGQELVG
jgi:hypothetical protein